ncbi:glycoside hydrolase family 1 protein [Prauserella muralis]|uniref:beta-glucosidase n=1 Tax=Prauserella muralis TaxID=588067 RepID=A0A2V4B0X7_9PSEU|nr:beta-glucosidase [Prauserella muralis]PXY27683.1 beta-glucosidase [Prauserella muralis]TWE22576.1 beta-glucosidase [Prauserella muralis]
MTTQTSTTTSETVTFPDRFLWGAATAAYQIEGAVDEDGRTPSIWDSYVRIPGAVLNGDTGDVACDHYHRMPEDVALMKRLNLASYRFSTAWPRVRPDGGDVNQKGVDFYDALVDELLSAGIEPWVTLYHWDLPQALEDQGGWLNRDTAQRFVEYALTMYDALGDRVRHWTTLNEPYCSSLLGYTSGRKAPGRQEGVAGLVAAHHLLLAHGMTVDELRRRGATPGNDRQVGITLNLTTVDPFDAAEPADREAARRVDGFFNRLFLDPLFKGRYPEDLADDTKGLTYRDRPWQDCVRDSDLNLISTPLDTLGINYYNPQAASGRSHDDLLGAGVPHAPRPAAPPFPGGGDIVFPRRGLPTTAMDWEVQPEALTRLLLRVHDDYAVPPIYITENGAAYDDLVTPEGAVHDADRTRYLDLHLRAVHDAIGKGVDVRGYFVWSLLDNFEWAFGYLRRFGIIHVDYDTQVRTVKDSGLWYAGVAATNQLPEA